MKVIKTEDIKLGEELHKVVLDSGLEVFIYPKAEYTKKYAFFATKYGALYNRFTDEHGKEHSLPFGVAHFLEHKIFEEQEGDVFARFATNGANVNAYTNFNSTVYYFSTVEHFEENVKLLIDFVLTPHINVENVEKEKGIIVQEIKMYDDDPLWRVYFNGLSAMYHNHPIGIDIAGTESSVNATTVEDLMTAYEKFYSPKNMMMFVIGDFDVDEIKEKIIEFLPESFLSKNDYGNLVLSDEPAEVRQEFVKVKMDVPIPILNYFIKCKPVENQKEAFEKSIKMRIALDAIFGKSSEFYHTNYEEGVLSMDFGQEFAYGQNYAYLAIGGETRDYELLISRIKETLVKSKNSGIEESDFKRIKRKMLGRYISTFNSTQYIANSFINYYMKGLELFDFMDIMNKVTLEEVNQTLRSLEQENASVSIIE